MCGFKAACIYIYRLPPLNGLRVIKIWTIHKQVIKAIIPHALQFCKGNATICLAWGHFQKHIISLNSENLLSHPWVGSMYTIHHYIACKVTNLNRTLISIPHVLGVVQHVTTSRAENPFRKGGTLQRYLWKLENTALSWLDCQLCIEH